MNYGLPTAVDISGKRHEIRTDYRAVLDIIAALADPELSDTDKLNILLTIFYGDNRPDDIAEAVEKCYWFINCGQPESKSNQPKLMDWEQDFPLIAAAINIVAGKEIRAVEYMHWWTFMGYYMNVGDSMFSQIVAIRKKLIKQQKLDKAEREFYDSNRELVEFNIKTTPEEDELINTWIGGGKNGS